MKSYRVDILIQGEERFLTYRGNAEYEQMAAEDAYAWYFSENEYLYPSGGNQVTKVFKTEDKSVTFYVEQI